ncbi:hypothetical protein EDB81DRAFT_950036 [Dactylonectria macrodidyma]|uniref:Zn(2)-C6 fungal-type domain-containing protein n=1 Tax=Dactylonectria macrodidyma TaxID=307937 RepID=A0A9P9E9W8_9HYPO|nr:hypothetical protein EDB81DRAFT_950036 [Dactylonectria macrodidyma]
MMPAGDKRRPSLSLSQRERARWACTLCRIRKVKCDAALPCCSQCTERGSLCIYAHARTRAQTSRRPVRDFSRRLEGVEHAISELPPPGAKSQQTDLAPSHAGRFVDATDLRHPHFLYNLMRLNALPISYLWDVDQGNTKLYRQTSCGIFLIGNMRCIDHIVGNHKFSTMAYERIPRHSNNPNSGLGHISPLPTPDLIVKCLDVFLSTINKHFCLFQEEEITSVFQSYLRGGICSQSSCYAALNIICAYSLGILLGFGHEQPELYLQNSLKALPSILLEGPSTTGVGAILLAVLYLMTTLRTTTAASMLGMASQMILVAGYHDPTEPMTLEVRHQKRLFWHAYILDQSLSLRLSKSSLFSEEMVSELPDLYPLDGYGVITLPNGSVLNHFREQVVLSKVQSKIYRTLRSSLLSKRTSSEFLASRAELLAELEQWKDSLLPLSPPSVATELGEAQLACSALLQSSYYQALVAIYSSIFSNPTLANSSVCRDQICPATHTINLCMIHDISWCLDGLFLHLLQNKNSVEGDSDLQLLKDFVDFLSRQTPHQNNNFGLISLSISYEVASQAATRG